MVYGSNFQAGSAGIDIIPDLSNDCAVLYFQINGTQKLLSSMNLRKCIWWQKAYTNRLIVTQKNIIGQMCYIEKNYYLKLY